MVLTYQPFTVCFQTCVLKLVFQVCAKFLKMKYVLNINSIDYCKD